MKEKHELIFGATLTVGEYIMPNIIDGLYRMKAIQ